MTGVEYGGWVHQGSAVGFLCGGGLDIDMDPGKWGLSCRDFGSR